jgi:hypothetical protein
MQQGSCTRISNPERWAILLYAESLRVLRRNPHYDVALFYQGLMTVYRKARDIVRVDTNLQALMVAHKHCRDSSE